MAIFYFTSRKSVSIIFISVVIFRPSSLKIASILFRIWFLVLSVPLAIPSPSSRYSPTADFSKGPSLQVSRLRRYIPHNSEASAPSQDPIVTSNLPSVPFLTYGVPFLNRKLSLLCLGSKPPSPAIFLSFLSQKW